MSLVDDIKTTLHSIDEHSKSRETRKVLYAELIEFIHMHSRTKQLSKRNMKSKRRAI